MDRSQVLDAMVVGPLVVQFVAHILGLAKLIKQREAFKTGTLCWLVVLVAVALLGLWEGIIVPITLGALNGFVWWLLCKKGDDDDGPRRRRRRIKSTLTSHLPKPVMTERPIPTANY